MGWHNLYYMRGMGSGDLEQRRARTDTEQLGSRNKPSHEKEWNPNVARHFHKVGT